LDSSGGARKVTYNLSYGEHEQHSPALFWLVSLLQSIAWAFGFNAITFGRCGILDGSFQTTLSAKWLVFGRWGSFIGRSMF